MYEEQEDEEEFSYYLIDRKTEITTMNEVKKINLDPSIKVTKEMQNYLNEADKLHCSVLTSSFSYNKKLKTQK